MQYKNNSVNISIEVFAKMTTTMNPVAIACFVKTTCYNIFKHLFITSSKDGRFFDPVSTYFSIIEINAQKILHVYCLVWLCGIFHIRQLCKQLQMGFEYPICIV